MSEEKEPSGLPEAFDRAIEALSCGSARYALIGGFAVAYHGIPRPTRDLDFLLATPRVALPELLQRFRDRGFGFSMERVLAELGRDHLSTITYGSVRVDLLDAVIPLFRRAVENAATGTVRGQEVKIVRAEELVALKMIAAREDDVRDIRGILAAQGDSLDLESIRRSIAECCDEERIARFERLVAEWTAGGGVEPP